MWGQVVGVLNHVGELFGSRIRLTARHGTDQASEPSNRRALRARRYALLLPSFLAPSDRPTDTFSHTNGQGAQLPLSSLSLLSFSARNIDVSSAYIVRPLRSGGRENWERGHGGSRDFRIHTH